MTLTGVEVGAVAGPAGAVEVEVEHVGEIFPDYVELELSVPLSLTGWPRSAPHRTDPVEVEPVLAAVEPLSERQKPTTGGSQPPTTIAVATAPSQIQVRIALRASARLSERTHMRSADATAKKLL